ncbi:MAG TPA: RICIN domain-containing protein [Cytophagales bacterium]|nr:RICIN domain-containing protein [Cytophagales bacterium]
MKKFSTNLRWSTNLCLILFLLFNYSAFSQTIMFDDFTYSSVDDAQLPSFNKWSIVNGTSGPPEGGQYSRNNITFINDPGNSANKLMTLSTTVNGSTKATTHSRIETAGYEYFHGTYAARVYFSDVPFTYKDGNVQTFYTIVSSALSGDGSRYSELDFEYLAADKWGISPDNRVMYMTSWNRYIAEPWQAWKRYFASQQSWAGWHTCVVSCTDGVNVKFWIDGTYFGAMSTTDNDGSSVYPRNPMNISFANWIWNNVTGSSTANRTTTMQVDWVLFQKDQELSPGQVNSLVASYRSQGLQRRNLQGQTYVSNPPTGIVSGSVYSIINVHSNKAMEVSNFSTANGGNVQQWDNVGASSQKWRATSVGGGAYNLINIHSGKALDVAGVSTANGANIHQWDYVGGNNQKWQIISNGDGTYRIISVHSGKAAETGGFSTANGGNVQQWEYVGANSQKWRFTQTSARIAAPEVVSSETKLLVYPNPVTESLFIDSKEDLTGAQFKIISAQGKEILKGVSLQNGIDVSNLKPGIYNITINANGKKINKRFIKD